MNMHSAPPLSPYRQTLLEKMPPEAICAEIGVWKGAFSRNILKVTQPRKLFLIDPWICDPAFMIPGDFFDGDTASNQEEMDRIHDTVCQGFAGETVEVVRKSSENAANDFPDCSFDWVYIDGNHYYDYVRQDLELWFPKVKPGGYLTGDDYLWRDKDSSRPVATAIADFLKQTPCPEATTIGAQFAILKALAGSGE